MHVLVTGGTGFIGSHAIAALVRDGHTVRSLARTPDKQHEVLAAHGVSIDDVMKGDIVEPDSVEAALEGVEAVVHTAAVIGLKRKDAPWVFDTNVAGVHNVIGGAARRGLDPIVYTSSISALFPPPGPIIDLDTPVVQPTMGYQASKSVTEHIVRAMAAAGHPIVTLYPGGVTGPIDPTIGDFHTSIIDQVNRGILMQTAGGMPLIDVRDIADGIAASMKPGRGAQRMMMGGNFLTLEGLRLQLEAALGRPLRPVNISGAALRGVGRMGDVVKRFRDFEFPMTHEAMTNLTKGVPTDDSATWSTLGIVPRDVAVTITDMVRWLVENKHIDAERAPALT